MSVDYAKEITDGDGGFISTSGKGATRVFHLKCSAVTDDRDTIYGILGTTITSTALPTLYSQHPDDNQLYCTKIVPRRLVDRLNWHLSCEYQLLQTVPAAGSTVVYPWDQDPKISFGSGPQYTRPVEKAYDVGDAQGAPTKEVQNSAEDPFDPPLTEVYTSWLCRIQRNIKDADFNMQAHFDAKNTINANRDQYAGVLVEAHYARMLDIGATKQWFIDPQGDVHIYWSVNYEIEMSNVEFVQSVVDQGFHTLVLGVKSRILLDDGKPPAQPQRLDNGSQLADGGATKYLDFQTVYAMNWNVLGLPRDA